MPPFSPDEKKSRKIKLPYARPGVTELWEGEQNCLVTPLEPGNVKVKLGVWDNEHDMHSLSLTLNYGFEISIKPEYLLALKVMIFKKMKTIQKDINKHIKKQEEQLEREEMQDEILQCSQETLREAMELPLKKRGSFQKKTK